MKLYTCAFAFAANKPHDAVLLIRKAKPDWQRGLLNGIGGKVEEVNGRLETIEQATIREFQEETGLYGISFKPIIYHSMLWPEYLTHNDWPLVYFSAIKLTYSDMQEAVSNTISAAEPCVIQRVSALEQARHEMMPNLPFLIEMAQCLAICAPKDRYLRQPVVPTPGDWANWIEEGRSICDDIPAHSPNGITPDGRMV